jgi:DNA polymerase V
MHVDQIAVFAKEIEPCVPLASSSVSAGFPSPAEDYLEHPLDLNAYVTEHPEATFFVKVQGDSMLYGHIHDGDILVVDKSLEVRPGQVVIAALHGEMVVKRLQYMQGKYMLMPENPAFKPIEITEDFDCLIWGVVTYVLHSLLP